MNNIFFFQTQQILDDTILFNELKQQKIFYSYFQVDQNYYLFVYSQNSIDINFLYQSIDVIEELDSKQQKLQSFRGFFLYALETMEKGKEYEILETNLQPFFWRKVKTIIRQNKKGALLEFLFGSTYGREEVYTILDTSSSPTVKILEDQIQALQKSYDALRSQVESLQQKIIQLQSKLENPKYALSQLSQPLKSYKTIQQKYNLHSNQEKGQNEHNFITLSKLSEQQRIEIIQKGFQLQAEGKISVKKYYEDTDPNSLFQLKGYSIKYETIRRTKLYQQFKPSNK